MVEELIEGIVSEELVEGAVELVSGAGEFVTDALMQVTGPTHKTEEKEEENKD